LRGTFNHPSQPGPFCIKISILFKKKKQNNKKCTF